MAVQWELGGTRAGVEAWGAPLAVRKQDKEQGFHQNPGKHTYTHTHTAASPVGVSAACSALATGPLPSCRAMDGDDEAAVFDPNARACGHQALTLELVLWHGKHRYAHPELQS